MEGLLPQVDLLFVVVNHLLTGVILQVGDESQDIMASDWILIADQVTRGDLFEGNLSAYFLVIQVGKTFEFKQTTTWI